MTTGWINHAGEIWSNSPVTGVERVDSQAKTVCGILDKERDDQ